MNNYKRAKAIYNLLTNEEKKLISPSDDYKNTNNLLYRYILNLDNNKSFYNDVGFVDIYQFLPFKTTGFIILAIKPEFRKQGYGKLLLDNAIKASKNLGLKKLIYRCDINNLPSITLAKSYGLTLSTKGKEYYSFYYQL